MPVFVQAADNVYYSVGQSTANLMTGADFSADNFNRANEDPIANGWTTGSGFGSPYVYSNAYSSGNSGFYGAYWSDDTFSADQYSSVVPGGVNTNSGPAVRIATSGGTKMGYFAAIYGASVQIKKINDSTVTQIGSNYNHNWVAGDVYALAIKGNVLTVFINGVAQSPSVTDDDFSTGQPGIISEPYWACDDWEGGSLSSVDINSGVATFSTAQIGNIGVGDRITSTVGSLYISGKVDQSRWNVVTVIGAIPANATGVGIISIKREFTSLSAALPSGAGGAKTLLGNVDLTAIDVALNIACYYDSAADTTAVTIDGWTTDATRYIKVYTPNNVVTEANQSQRHQGKWDDTKYNLQASVSGFVLTVNEQYTIVDGIQVKNTGTGINNMGAAFDVNYQTVKNSIVIAGESSNQGTRAVRLGSWGPSQWNYLYNNIFINASTGSGLVLNTNGSVPVLLYNCTLISNNSGQALVFSTDYQVVVNSLAQTQNGTAFYNSATWSASCRYNASDDATAPGTNSRTDQIFTFIDFSNYDLHLAPTDTGAKNFGTDQVSEIGFSTDIDSQSRSGLNWDIGADEATFNGPFSVSAWVNPSVTPTSKTILAKAEEIRIATDATSHPVCQIKSQQTWQTAAVSSDALAAGQWTQVSCVYDQVNLKIYLNGVEKGSQALTAGVDNMTSNWKIGQDDSSGTTYANWTGLVDDFVFYDYARDVEEVQSDFSRGAATSPHNASVGKPLTDYNFDEGFGDAAHNNGTLSGTLPGTLQPGSGGTNTSASQMWTLDGIMGKGVELDGTDDRVELPDAEY